MERQSRTATTISSIVQIIVVSDPFISVLLIFSSLMTVPLLEIGEIISNTNIIYCTETAVGDPA